MAFIGIMLAFISYGKAVSGSSLDVPNYEEVPPLSSSSPMPVSSTYVVMMTVVVLSFVVLILAVAWRRYPSASSAIQSTFSSIVDALSGRRRRPVIPSNVRHRLRLRLPAASASGFPSSDSPTPTGGWATRMLALQAKRLQLQQSLKDSGDDDVIMMTGAKNGSRAQQLMSLQSLMLTRQYSCTPSDLLPVDEIDAEITFFDRRLELLCTDY